MPYSIKKVRKSSKNKRKQNKQRNRKQKDGVMSKDTEAKLKDLPVAKAGTI